ncbi:MAG: site-2 protease family protein, partial [Candidatus Omnitrophica bacterium]|nr:site-2 protease family protein [Candidatus Omnitrophota bacterium]
MSILYLAAVVIILLLSVTIHEYAHAIVADKLGDLTPRSQGRLTLNPFSHLSILTTIVVPLLIVFASRGLIPPLARAKPVRINPYHFKNPRQDMILVGAAGPLANICLAA